MPMRDKTGPMGTGPMTGRGMGPCGFGSRGGGLGMGRGYGRAMCGWFYRQFQEMTKEERKTILKEEVEDLKQELKMVEDELSSLEKE